MVSFSVAGAQSSYYKHKICQQIDSERSSEIDYLDDEGIRPWHLELSLAEISMSDDWIISVDKSDKAVQYRSTVKTVLRTYEVDPIVQVHDGGSAAPRQHGELRQQSIMGVRYLSQ